MSDYYVHPSSFIDEGANISKGCKVWHFSHIMQGTSLGENCMIGQNVFVAQHVNLGNNVKVQNNVSIYSGVQCEDDVFIGPSVVFTNILNPRSTIDRKHAFQNTYLRRGCTIGANATILCGIEIGIFAMIGAGTVVTKSVKPYSLFVGNPGKHVGWRSEYGDALNFDEKGLAVCGGTNETYQLMDNNVTKIIK